MSGDKVRCMIGVVCLSLVGCASPSTDRTQPVINIARVTVNASPFPTDDLATAHAASLATLQANRTAVVQKLTGTPTITPTFYPMADLPNVPLSQDGPWLVFLAAIDERGPRYLWAVNPDGTGLKQLIDRPVIAFETQKTGNGVIIAYVTQSEEDENDLALKTITLPGGAVEFISTLFNERQGTEALSSYTVSAAVEGGGLSWSPDGSKLAFVGVLGGQSVDGYTYDISSKAITRLTDGPDQAYSLRWSPDGRYVVHEGFDFIGMGGPESSGIWAAHANGSGAIPLFAEDEFSHDATYNWLNSTEILLTNRCFGDCESDVRRVNIETGNTQIILKEQFTNVAYTQEYDTWLLSRSASSGSDTVLVLIRNGERTEIPGREISWVRWDKSQDMFVGETESGKRYTITLLGEITSISSPASWQPKDRSGYPLYTYLSPDNTLKAWHFYEFFSSFSELWIGEPTGEPKLIFSDNDLLVRDVTWSPDSQRLLSLTDHGLWMAERPDFKPVLLTEKLYANDWDGWGGHWIP